MAQYWLRKPDSNEPLGPCSGQVLRELIEKGPVLKHGNTIGVDAKNQMRIRHAPSMYDRLSSDLVLRIEGA